MESVEEDFVRSLVWAGKTHQEISTILQNQFPAVQRGFSTRSVRRYCSNRNIHQPTVPELDNVVSHCVDQVSSSDAFFNFSESLSSGVYADKFCKYCDFCSLTDRP